LLLETVKHEKLDVSDWTAPDVNQEASDEDEAGGGSNDDEESEE
jgi:hypothetical protein